MVEKVSKVNLSKIAKWLHIDHWTKESQILVYLSIESIVFYLLAFFQVIPSWVLFINFFFCIIILGFIFTRADKKYNVTIVLVIFFVSGILVSSWGQLMLSADATIEYKPTHYVYDVQGNRYTHILSTGEILDSDGFPITWQAVGQVIPQWKWMNARTAAIIEWEEESRAVWIKKKNEYRYWYFDYQENKYVSPDEAEIYTWKPWPKHYETKDKEVLQLSEFEGFAMTEDESYTDSGKNFAANVKELTETPLTIENIGQKIETFMDIVNWIFLIAILAYGGSAIGDAIKLDWGKIAIKAATIALTISIYTLIVGIFQAVKIDIKTIWETAGRAWNSLMKKIGIAQLNAQSGEIVEFSIRTVSNGIYRLLPIILPIIMLTLALYFRKSEISSILFAKKVKRDIDITQSRFKPFTLVVIAGYMIYLVGYILVNVDTSEIMGGTNPLQGIAFGILAIISLLMISLGAIYLNPRVTVSSTIKWTIYGFFGLMLYFQFIQPTMYNMGLRDTYSDLDYLSQGSSVIDSDILKQLFLVAMPETLIFQILVMGIGGRVYYWIRKGRAIEEQELMLEAKERLYQQQKKAILNRLIRSEKGITDKEKNRIWLIEASLIERKLLQLELKLKPEPVPHRFFIVPAFIAGLLGSFVFSDYHRFRRGLTFSDWWRSNNGLAFMGAGFWLCFIAFFNIWSAILVHTLNNVMALLIAR